MDRSKRRRWTAAALAIALHLAILALFLHSHPPLDKGAGEGTGAMDISLAGFSKGPSPKPTPAAPARPAPAAQPAPPTPPEPIKPRSDLAIVSDILSIPVPRQSVSPTPLAAPPSPVMAQAIAQASGAPGAACDIDGAVQTALRLDPDVHGAVLLIPTTQRTAANAVLLWNGQWISSEAEPALAVDTLRIAIRRIVAAASPECRDQEIVGPRFMLIPDGDATMVLVFGNSAWRWSDLLIETEQTPSVRPRTN